MPTKAPNLRGDDQDDLYSFWFPRRSTPFQNGVLGLFLGLCLLGLTGAASAQEYQIIAFDVPDAGTRRNP
jgi:hypothetical protein